MVKDFKIFAAATAVATAAGCVLKQSNEKRYLIVVMLFSYCYCYLLLYWHYSFFFFFF